jgi:hypothetical protein
MNRHRRSAPCPLQVAAGDAGILARSSAGSITPPSLYAHSDIRTGLKYLDESQAAWKSYVDANCTVVAALGGGSNSAISDREGACYEKELDLRIAFLREVKDESSR